MARCMRLTRNSHKDPMSDLVFSKMEYLQASTASKHPPPYLSISSPELLTPQVRFQAQVWILSQPFMPCLYVSLCCICLQEFNSIDQVPATGILPKRYLCQVWCWCHAICGTMRTAQSNCYRSHLCVELCICGLQYYCAELCCQLR